jgi:signal transduction histidine kinase
MGRRAKSPKGKSPKDEGARVRDLEKRLAEALRRETEALDQQTATSEILRVISNSPTDVQPVFDTIIKNAVRLCAVQEGSVFGFDGHLIHLVASETSDTEFLDILHRVFPRAPGRDSPTARAILTRSVTHVPDLLADPDYRPTSTLQHTRRSILSVPMLRDGEPIGAITLGRRDVRAFSDKQIALLQTFADQAVIAIENARLFKELEMRNKALTESLEQQTATAAILRIISSSPTDMQPVMDAVAENAARICGATDATIRLLEGDMLRLVARFGSIPLGAPDVILCSREYPAGRSVIECRTIHIEDILPLRETEFPPIGTDQRTVLATPLMREGQPIGVILIRRVEVQPFTNKQVALLQTFADQAVIAIENVRLFNELAARNRELGKALERQTATADILRAISQAQTDVQPVFEAIADSAMRLFGAWSAGVVRYDGEMVSMVAARGGLPGSADAAKERLRAPHRPGNPPELSVLTKRVHHVVDVETDPSSSAEFRRHAAQRGFRSFVAVPMLRGEDAVGVIAVTRAEPRSFTPDEITLLQTFADQAVIAVANARLLTELQARTAELQRSVGHLTALGEVGRAVSSTLDLQTVLTTIVARAVQLSGLDGGVVFEYDEAAEEFAPRAMTDTIGVLAEARRTARIRKGEGVLGRTAITLEPVQVADIALPGAYEGRLREILIDSGIRAILAVPMVHQGRLIGCLGVTRNRSGEFAAETIELLRTFATQSALAIQNARLFQEIEDKSRQLEAASQHKSEFLANMSHELRTPLNAVIGFSEVLSERMFGELNEKQEEYLKDIHASGQHLLSLINDILDLSKIEAGRMELEVSDFDLPMAIDNAMTLIRERAARRSIALHTTVDERLGQMHGDERKIRQILLNLLSNAIKFTPEGGRIDVHATVVDGMAEVSVTDTGVGIAPEDQAAVFEEFRQVGTADKKVEGTGLGLALSRKFIELHGGRIWVKSQLGTGSTFTFAIPVRREPGNRGGAAPTLIS